MKLNPRYKNMSYIIITLILFGCGGSSNDSHENGYIQFYNGSYNSPNTTLVIEDVIRTGANFGEVSTRHGYQADTYEISYEHQKDDGDWKSIYQQDIKIDSGYKQLLLMTGDFKNPDFTEVTIKNIDVNDKNIFNLSFINTIRSDVNFDVYMAVDNTSFSEAKLITTTTSLMESDFINYSPNSYTFYMTKSGENEVIFSSEQTSFYEGSSYLAIIRDGLSVADNSIIIDIVSDTNHTTTLKHSDAKGQIHFYNSLNLYDNVTFTATNLNNSTAPIIADTFSSYIKLPPADYSISMKDELTGKNIIDNYLITLNHEESLAAIVYQDDNRINPSMKSITENLTPNSISHDIQIINLIDSYDDISLNQVDVYFTKTGQSIEDTKNHAKDINKYEQKSLTIDNDIYTIQVVFDDNGQLRSLVTMTEQAFTEEGHYVLILEEIDHSENHPGKFKVTIEHTLASAFKKY